MGKGVAIPYSAAELDFIEKNKTMPRKDLTEMFNRLFERDLNVKHIAALCKRKGWLSGRTGHFEKGQKAWNSGTKGLMKPNSGTFRKGCVPPNTAKVGDEVVTKGWVKVKVAEPNVWRNKSHVVWEENGREPLKKGQHLVHIDGDFTNNAIENLMLIERADLLEINRAKFLQMPQEVRPSMVWLARLNTKRRSLRGRK